MRAEEIVLRQFGGMGVHRARLLCIAKVTAAALVAGRVALTAVGRALGGAAKPRHAIKCVDRVLGNVLLLKEILLFQQRLVQLVPSHRRPVLLIDWTDIGTLWSALVVSQVSEGRGTTLCWEVHPRRKNNSPRVEASMLRKLEALLPPGCKPILVSDAGFRGPWLQKVLDRGWDFVGRVRGRLHVQRVGSGAWRPVKSLWKEASARPRNLGMFTLARYLPVQARLVTVWKRRRIKRKLPRIGRRKQRAIRSAREPWVLATSLRDATSKEIVALYALRMRIELTFRDQKCPRFGLALDQVRTRSRERVEVYLLFAALAHFVAMVVGQCAERLGLHRSYQANTITSRRVLSWARLGREVLLHQLRTAARDDRSTFIDAADFAT